MDIFGAVLVLCMVAVTSAGKSLVRLLQLLVVSYIDIQQEIERKFMNFTNVACT